MLNSKKSKRVQKILVEIDNKDVNDGRYKMSDPNAPKTSERYGMDAAKDMAILADYFKMAANYNPSISREMQKAFLRMLLVPEADMNKFAVTGFANN